MDLSGKKVVVTGGTHGIGKAVVEQLLAKGAVVSVIDLDVAEGISGVEYFQCDLSNRQQLEGCFAELLSSAGKIDVLVNNAGMVSDHPLVGFGFQRHSLELWDKLIAVNLTAVFHLTSLVAEHMMRNRIEGVIVNVSSIAANGNPGQTAYSAAKAGVKAMSRLWADELAYYKIRVCCIAPGFTCTSITEKMKESSRDWWKSKTPLKRFATPDEIAKGILFMVENDFVDGSCVPLDGGLRM